MFKTLLAATTALFLTSATYASTLKEVGESTYKLYYENSFVCTAVAVSETQLVTAAHCIPPEISMYKGMAIVVDKWNRTQLIHREIITVNPKRVTKDDDTAFLEIRGDSKLPVYVDIADEYSPVMGDPLYAVGYPRGAELTLTEGMFTVETNLEKEFGLKGTFWKVTVPITGGSSGGGFYKRTQINGEWDYKLIGLASATYNDVSFQSYITTLDTIKDVISGFLKKGTSSSKVCYVPKDYESLIISLL